MKDTTSDAAQARRIRYGMVAKTLDDLLVQHTLIDSYQSYVDRDQQYPFIKPQALNPTTVRHDMKEADIEGHNTGLVFLTENRLHSSWLQYINFWEMFTCTKKSIEPHSSIDPDFKERFSQKKAEVDHPDFIDALKNFSELDYGLLVQPYSSEKNRFFMTHFHVRVDYPLVSAAEEKAVKLGYLQGKLHEQEPKVMGKLMSKFFQYYGLHFRNASGRRTAGAIASHLLEKNDGHFSVYIASEQSRVMQKITRQDITKYALVQLENPQELAEHYPNLEQDYLVDHDVAIMRAHYTRTKYGRPLNKDGKPPSEPRQVTKNSLIQMSQKPELVPKPYLNGVEPIQDTYRLKDAKR